MKDTMLSVTHKVGLHARPASMFVKMANKFSSRITVRNATTGEAPVDAKSIISVLTLGVLQNHQIAIVADGPDEEAAIQSLSDLIVNNFGEA